MYTVQYHQITRIGHAFFSKERNALAFFGALYKRMWRSLRSFAFFIKECAFFAFFHILYKRMRRSLRLFWFHKSFKNDKSRKKKNVKERCFLF